MGEEGKGRRFHVTEFLHIIKRVNVYFNERARVYSSIAVDHFSLNLCIIHFPAFENLFCNICEVSLYKKQFIVEIHIRD